ncbi:hypothetical protein Trydic_g4894 [Trypoxylus dichotomus]
MGVRGQFKVTGVHELHLCPPGPVSTEGDIRDIHGASGLIRGLMTSTEMWRDFVSEVRGRAFPPCPREALSAPMISSSISGSAIALTFNFKSRFSFVTFSDITDYLVPIIFDRLPDTAERLPDITERLSVIFEQVLEHVRTGQTGQIGTKAAILNACLYTKESQLVLGNL